MLQEETFWLDTSEERVVWTRRRRLRQAGRPDGKRVLFPSFSVKKDSSRASEGCVHPNKGNDDVTCVPDRPIDVEKSSKRAPRRQVLAVVSHLLFETV